MLLLLGEKAGDPGKTSGLMLYLSESLCGPVGILFFLDKSQFQGTEKVDILALLKLDLGVGSPLT